MTSEALLALLPVHGPWLMAVVTFAACLMIPAPASLMLLAGGAFSAAGDLDWRYLAAGALAGAAAGDLTCWRLGGVIGPRLAQGRGAEMLARARALLERHGVLAVYFSRWLFSPLGPYVNLVAGAAGMGLARLLPPLLAGEATWIAIYLGLGRVFGANYEAVEQLASSALGLAAAGGVAAMAGRWLWKRRRRDG